METFWDEDQSVATERFFIIDVETGEVTRHAASTQGYEEEQLDDILAEIGYNEITFFPSLTGKAEHIANDFLVITARRPE
jgi:hypothetical protein